MERDLSLRKGWKISDWGGWTQGGYRIRRYQRGLRGSLPYWVLERFEPVRGWVKVGNPAQEFGGWRSFAAARAAAQEDSLKLR